VRNTITEERVKTIHAATNLTPFSHDELVNADNWIKRYALNKLHTALHDVPKPIREYIELMARCHYGSVETDEFLQEMHCYPLWMGNANNSVE
jgi:hypothetical protein